MSHSDCVRASNVGLTLREYKNRMAFFRQVFSNQEYLFCIYCKCELNNETLTLEHVIPLSKGGEHVLENVEPCCFECNQNSTKEDFAPNIRMRPNLDKNGKKVCYE